MSLTTVHLVYIHGFQGNDTTFQSFPTHLQEHVAARVPAHLKIKIISSIYPTYKSVKPISHATKNFLEWLSTQPPGPVIILGHSMGGLLAAEAATHPSNNPGEHPGAKPRRIMGMIAFDCPYLGMHPHVIISGISSLLPGDKDDEKASEVEMNNMDKVNMVDEKVTDDWEGFKQKLDVSTTSLSSSHSSISQSSRSPSPGLLDRALDYVSARSDDPIVRWVRKHRDEPLKAGKRWIVERFQFGICMFDPPGLRERYANLVEWKGGLWVNYWTQTRPKTPRLSDSEDDVAENDAVLLETGVVHTPPDRKKKDSKKKKVKKPKPGKHFIVLPTGLGKLLGGDSNWERVLIEGVNDEVAAHTGLFIPGQNLDYQGLVERTGTKVLDWCEKIHNRAP